MEEDRPDALCEITAMSFSQLFGHIGRVRYQTLTWKLQGDEAKKEDGTRTIDRKPRHVELGCANGFQCSANPSFRILILQHKCELISRRGKNPQKCGTSHSNHWMEFQPLGFVNNTAEWCQHSAQMAGSHMTMMTHSRKRPRRKEGKMDRLHERQAGNWDSATELWQRATK